MRRNTLETRWVAIRKQKIIYYKFVKKSFRVSYWQRSVCNILHCTVYCIHETRYTVLRTIFNKVLELCWKCLFAFQWRYTLNVQYSVLFEMSRLVRSEVTWNFCTKLIILLTMPILPVFVNIPPCTLALTHPIFLWLNCEWDALEHES